MICNTRSPKRYKLAAPKQEDPGENNDINDLQRDPFEDLPNEVIHHIMSFLPTIKNIAQLSLLSHLWLHLWSTYPYLNFFGVKVPTSLRHLPMAQRRFTLEYYTEHIFRSSFSRRPLYDNDPLSSTTSKIYTFYLSGYLSYNGFHQCIYNALMHDVEDLKLQVSFTGCYNLPEKLFTCKAMQSLELSAISDPPHGDFVYRSFTFPLCYMVAWLNKDADPYLRSQLRTLSLDHVTFPSIPFAPGIDFFSDSYFPYLTRLSLSECEGVDFLAVSCPNLVYLEIKSTEMIKLVLMTPKLLTLRVICCFTKDNVEVTLVDIWAPRLQVFQWRGNGLPYQFYVRAPTHVVNSVVSLRYLDVEARVESSTNLLSLFSMAKTISIGQGFLMVLERLDFYGIQTCLGACLVKLKLRTAMTKKQILGVWYLLRKSAALRILDVHVTRPYYAEDNHNWGRSSLDNDNISEVEYWARQCKYQAPILQHLEVVKIKIQKDVEGRDMSFASFLLQKCQGLKFLTMTVSSTVFNEALIDIFQLQICCSDRASPDVQMLVEIE